MGTPSLHPDRETIVVLDFGSQYSRLICRRVREARVYAELLPWNAAAETIRALRPIGIILSGGPASVYETDAPTVPPPVFNLGVPILGICYGMQLLAHQLGGKVAPAPRREYGAATIHVAAAEQDGADVASRLFRGLPAELPVWMSHGDHVEELPPGFRVLARSANSPAAAMADGQGRVGLQFHPEVVHTPQGQQLIENFCYGLCGATGGWTAGSFIAEATEQIRQPCGPRSGRLRPLRWRGLGGDGGARPPRYRRSADLHLRGQRPATAERGRRCRGDLSAPLGVRASGGERGG